MMNRTLRPCDCHDQATANKLDTQGVGHNADSIRIEPSVAILTMGNTTIRIPMHRFKMFAEWYLSPQSITTKRPEHE